VAAEIITIASLKGRVGKTTVSRALAAAASAGGLQVLAIDLDPTGGANNSREKAKAAATMADVLAGQMAVKDAFIEHPMGGQAAASQRNLGVETNPEAALRHALESVLDEYNVVLLDTHPDEAALFGPMAVADRIIVPTALDILSLRAAALTVGFAQQIGVLERIRGIVVSDVERPMSAVTESLLNGLTMSGLAFETILWHSDVWATAAADGPDVLDDDLLAQSSRLLREVAVRPEPVEALRQFISLAQGRRPPEVPAIAR
jgi:cellulose biosynthesis protein BcsQ